MIRERRLASKSFVSYRLLRSYLLMMVDFRCDADYSGLYCEIEPPLSSTVHMPKSSTVLPWILGLLFLALGIAIAYYCVWKYKPEWM